MALITSIAAYWKLEDLTDSAGSNTLTNVNSVSFSSSGKIGSCATFNGTSNYLTSPYNIPYGDFTISSWIKLSTTGTEKPIYSGRDVGTGSPIVNFQISSGNTLVIALRNNSGSGLATAVSSGTFTTGTWYHVVVTYSSGTMQLYINGSADGSGSYSGGTWSNINDTRFGRDNWNNTYMNGAIDETGIWTRALSSGEVTSLYNSGNGFQYPFSIIRNLSDSISNGSSRVATLSKGWLRSLTDTIGFGSGGGGGDITSNLVGWYKLDEGSGTTATDYSGTSNTGVIMGSAGYTTGKIGPYALNLTTNGQYVSTANLVNTAVSTLAAWIYITGAPSGKSSIIGFANGYTDATFDKQLYIDTDGKLYFYIFDGAAKTTSAPASSVPLNQWVHVLGVQNGSNMYTYVNGVQVGSVAAGNSFTGYSNPNLFIAGKTSTISTQFIGYIDDARAYSRALNSTDIAALYLYPATGGPKIVSATLSFLKVTLRSLTDSFLNASSRLTTIGRLFTGSRSNSDSLLNSVSRLATVSRVNTKIRSVADSFMNGVSRFTTVFGTKVSLRALSDSISNAASRFVTVFRMIILTRSLQDGIMNAANRLVTVAKQLFLLIYVRPKIRISPPSTPSAKITKIIPRIK